MLGSASTPGCVLRRRRLISCCVDNYTGKKVHAKKVLLIIVTMKFEGDFKGHGDATREQPLIR